ncbi:MAG: hypothetical protein IKS10_08220 [Lachnospiraceae bacterium]|nr:hypothetical protein [Lachnospiraceae bacterium]
MRTNSSKRRKAISMLLALTLVLSTLPLDMLPMATQVVNAAPASNADPTYNRVAAPEVAIFNAYTGADSEFYKSVLNSGNYNAVEAGYFGSLRYNTKVTGLASYSWSGFAGSNINSLRKNNADIKIGYSVTRTSNYHKHTSSVIFTYKMTSWSETSLGYNLGGIALNGVINYVGYSTSMDTFRQGNNKFSTFVPRDNTPLDLVFNISKVNYDDKVCSCGGSSEGCMVCFFDGNAPYFTRVNIQDASGANCSNFKPGDSVNIVLTCSESLRFADDSASGKGNVYIGLKLNGSTEKLYAHLTKLDGNQITFTYDAPADLKKIYDVAGIDLTAAPAGGTALLNKDAVVSLKQVKKSGAFTVAVPKDSKEIGITKTTSPVTDMAGNAVYLNGGDASNLARAFNIDGEKPKVASVHVVADTHNAEIKELLGKTNMQPNDENYEDNSDSYLGVGDSISLKVYMNEVVDYGSKNGTWVYGTAELTTNIKKKDGTYLSFVASPSYNVNAASVGLGVQYGRGASKGEVTILESAGKNIESEMTIDDSDGKIKITKIVYSGMKDLAGNIADNTNEFGATEQQYQIDTVAPSVEVEEVTGTNGTNYGFVVPFKTTDKVEGSNAKGSGVQDMPATLMLVGTLHGKFMYAVTTSSSEPEKEDWNEGVEGLSLPFIQTGDTQYLHVKKIADEPYGVSGLSFTLSDYAGNTGATKQVAVSGVGFDSVAPVVHAGNSSRSYDNDKNEGTLTANIDVNDISGVASVQYLWNDGTKPTESDSWKNAEGTVGGTSVSVAAIATVPSQTAFKKALWIKAKDGAGNVVIDKVDEYSYSLEGIKYELEYPVNVVLEPTLKINSLEDGGALVFDVQKPGDPDTHYILVCTNYQSYRFDNIYDLDNDWFTATLDETDGIKYTNLEACDIFVFYQDYKKLTGNFSVKVYSGTANINGTEQSADIMRSEWLSDSDSEITITTNAKVETFTLKVSYQSNGGKQMFSKYDFSIDTSKCTIEDENGYHTYIPTVEGAQVSIDLGEDLHGWNYSDIDWEKSRIKLENIDTGEITDVCGIGYGPRQTITLPAVNIQSGVYHIWVYLMRRSMPDDEDAAYRYVEIIYIDVTEPGIVKPETIAKQSTYSNSTGVYEAIAYDPDKTIYVPTQKYKNYLSVDVLDPDGVTPHKESEHVYGFESGSVYVTAWDTAHPDKKVQLLDRKCLAVDEESGEIYLREIDSSENTEKALLTFGAGSSATSNYYEILGLEPDQDNVIALQANYSNGRRSAITYLTIHPVSLELSGTTTTLPEKNDTWTPDYPTEWSGIYTVDPEKAAVVFTPDEKYTGVIASSGLRLYCGRGTSQQYDGTIEWADDFEPIEMTAQGDGSFIAKVPVYNKSINDAISSNNGGYNFKEFYCIYAEDIYGNRVDVSTAKAVIIADGTAPVISDANITTDANGKFTATYHVYDDSLYSFATTGNWYTHQTPSPITLEFSFNDEYARAIGASGGGLTLTMDVTNNGYLSKSWTAMDSNSMGIQKVTESLHTGETVRIDGETTPTDVYLTVTVEGYVSPKITSAMDMTLNLKATDVHGNVCDAVGATASVIGFAPKVIDKQYKQSTFSYTPQSHTEANRALFLTFNVPVQPAESWINRNIEGFSTEWHDAFPIWKDGTWDITFIDIFGTKYTQSLTLENVIGKYGFDLAFSTLDYVSASEGVTLTFMPDNDGERIYSSYGNNGKRTCTENGTYYLYWEGDGEYDLLPVHLNNIISGGPEETLFFYFDEFKEQYKAGSDEQFRGTTVGSVTVSYRTSRETNPVGDTTLTFKDGDSDTFTFQYYDIPTAITYTITGKLSDYGITLATPPEPYADVEAPTVDLVTIWKQQAGGFVQTEAFSGSADETMVKTAIGNAGAAQGYDFVVKASDYSKWKVVAKSSAPTSISYASATSDKIPGVSVSGNNILVTNSVANDFYIVVVDNAAADSAATKDNFTCVKIPYGSYQFDTVAPEIVTNTVADGLYSRTVYIKATDLDDAGNDTGSSVTLAGAGIAQNFDANAAEYPYKLLFTDNDTVVTVNATDAAGNSVSVNLQVSGIDVSSPILKTTWSPCFQDPVTGKLDRSNPTSVPVNTDIVAHVTSDKDIMNVTATYTYYDYTYDYDFNSSSPYWGYIEYTSQRVSVHFTESAYSEDIVVTLNITAPNGQATEVKLVLQSGIIDKDAPYLIVENVEELKRSGYDVPYAVTLHIRPTEEVYCTNYGPLGELYYDDADHPHLMKVTLKDLSPKRLFFVDKVGNQTIMELPYSNFGPWIPYFDSVAPTIHVDVPENANATNSSVSVTVTANEQCTLSCDNDAVTCGTMSLQGTDSEGNEIWIGTISASANGTFRVYAADGAGNKTSEVFTVYNVDKTLPTILFDTSTVNVRQESELSELTKLLDKGVKTWDNVGIQDGSLAYDVSGVILDTVGVYAVTYTVQDVAGNVGQSVRYVRVVDKNQPIITVDGILTEENGTISLKVGKHTLYVNGLKTDNEPYSLKLVKGIWSSGQMKRATKCISVGEDGSFTVDTAGFYTVYIVTQSRQTYRTLLYVEN